ncbi:MAG TPA: hypothetical protein P5273_10170, partial [Syntrophomonadaceae bacterium]|nr:hypothetical protein [Syntrophomonadaceae bacterium]
MSILSIARNKNRLYKHFLSLLALCLAFTLLLANAFCGNALAGSVGDVVTQVTNANLGSPEFNFGQEDVTGYDFALHASIGDFGGGGCAISVLGPVRPDEIQILINYVDSISWVT